jgi:hypothetical protein
MVRPGDTVSAVAEEAVGTGMKEAPTACEAGPLLRPGGMWS